MWFWLLALVACGGKDDGETGNSGDNGGGENGTGENGGGENGGGTGGNPDAPSVVAVNWLYCNTNNSSENYLVQLEATDPQGVDTFNQGTWDFYLGTGMIYSAMIVCASGSCTGSVSSTQGAPGCDQQSSLTHSFVLTDEDGNSSEPFEQEGAVNPE